MAEHQLGNAENAKTAFGYARDYMQHMPKMDGTGLVPEWPDWLRFALLRREAEQLLSGDQPPAPPGD
jgi:hypothetical protein